jgi:hypothetical protein
MKARFSFGILLALILVTLPAAGNEVRATVVYDDKATEISPAQTPAQTKDGTGQLWITTRDLTRATRFEVKPQGVCRDELCFPLPKARKQEFLEKKPGGGEELFNLTAFASLVHQPVAHDGATSTWYFGLRSDQQQGLASLRAPDFTLPDIDGKMHSLSDFRGKKVLLVTWASW